MHEAVAPSTCRAVFSVSVFSTGTRWTVRTRRHAEPFVEIYDAVLRDSAMCAAGRPGRRRQRHAAARARRRGCARRPRRSRPVAVPLRVRVGAPRPVLATKNAVRLMRARSEPDTRADAEPKDRTISGRADGRTKPCPTDAHTRPYSGDSVCTQRIPGNDKRSRATPAARQRQPRVAAPAARHRGGAGQGLVRDRSPTPPDDRPPCALLWIEEPSRIPTH